jgi:hypothetical protein
MIKVGEVLYVLLFLHHLDVLLLRGAGHTVLLANIRPARIVRKGLPETNGLAYLANIF